jgi:hypothetical protein
MNLKDVFFIALILTVCVGIFYYFDQNNNELLLNDYKEFFMAGIDEHINIGYGNIQHTPSNHPWRHHAHTPLLNNTMTTFGHDMPLSNFKNNPLDDGQRQMFLFAKNKCSPECCPSTYTCSGGCVCTTEEQRKLIDKRG